MAAASGPAAHWLRNGLGRAWGRVDRRALPWLYRAISVDGEAVARALRAEERAFLDRTAPMPRVEDVDDTAHALVHRTARKAGAVGGVAGVAGLLSVPPEALAMVVAMVRLAQRLAVVYGFDPSTDRGQDAVMRALAFAFEVAVPERGLREARLIEVVRLAAGSWTAWLPSPLRTAPTRAPHVAEELAPRAPVSAKVARAVAASGLKLAARGWTRLVPVVSAGWGAWDAQGRAVALGERVRVAMRRASDSALPPQAPLTEADEVR